MTRHPGISVVCGCNIGRTDDWHINALQILGRSGRGPAHEGRHLWRQHRKSGSITKTALYEFTSVRHESVPIRILNCTHHCIPPMGLNNARTRHTLWSVSCASMQSGSRVSFRPLVSRLMKPNHHKFFRERQIWDRQPGALSPNAPMPIRSRNILDMRLVF